MNPPARFYVRWLRGKHFEIGPRLNSLNAARLCPVIRGHLLDGGHGTTALAGTMRFPRETEVLILFWSFFIVLWGVALWYQVGGGELPWGWWVWWTILTVFFMTSIVLGRIMGGHHLQQGLREFKERLENENTTQVTNVKSLLVNWSFEDTVTIKQVTSGLINQTYIVCAPGPSLSCSALTPTSSLPVYTKTSTPSQRRWCERSCPHQSYCLVQTVTSGTLTLKAGCGGPSITSGIARSKNFIHPMTPVRPAALSADFIALSRVLLGLSKCATDSFRYLARLQQAVASTIAGTACGSQVAPLAAELQQAWDNWSGSSDLPTRIIHGDLKISNVRFQDRQALCLIDLDTLAQGTLDIELGDAMRSWCNPASEDSLETHFDLALFESAMWVRCRAARAAPPSHHEWSAIAPGIERICIELAARFAWDALAECYFGFNEQYGGRGEHNLLRARGQRNSPNQCETNGTPPTP